MELASLIMSGRHQTVDGRDADLLMLIQNLDGIESGATTGDQTNAEMVVNMQLKQLQILTVLH